MQKIKISIVLPLYNSLRYLEDCLRSIAAQTFKHFELIVIQDGKTSTSKMEENLVSEYGKKIWNPIRYEKRMRNKGIARSWNEGFEMASGEYFTWIGHDDMYFPNALEVMNDALDSNPDVGMVYPDLVVVRSFEKEPRDYQDFAVNFSNLTGRLREKIGSSRVIIYGAGTMAKMLYDVLDLKTAEIIDINAGNPEFAFSGIFKIKGRFLNHPNILHESSKELDCDYILVTPIGKKSEIQSYFRDNFKPWVSEKAVYVDDYLSPCIPSNFVDLISLNKISPEVDSVVIRKDEKTIEASTWRKPEFSQARLMQGNFLSHVHMYRRYIQDKIGEYDERYKIAMDYDYELRMSEHFKIMRIPEALAIINNNDDTFARSNLDLACSEAVEVMNETLDRRGDKRSFRMDETRHFVFKEKG